MQVILAVATESPYREAVLGFAQDLARLLEGRLRTAGLGPAPSAEELAAVEGAEKLDELAEEEAVGESVEGASARREVRRNGPSEVVWIGESPVQDTLRELAHCDFGVVGRALRGEPEGGAAITPEVERLTRFSTKPLVVVPKKAPPVKKALFVFTEHPESGHALSLAHPLSRKGVAIKLVTLIPTVGRTELLGAGAGYLKAHEVPFDQLKAECEHCREEGGPVSEIFHHVRQENIDLVVMGGTRRGLVGRLLWPDMAREVVWNAQVPVLVWY